MSEYPIEGLMNTAMNSIKEMVDVNTIVGDPIQTSNNVVIIPISKVNFGFAAGGSEFNGKTTDNSKKEELPKERLPFGGGSGAGVTINPVAFLVITQDNVRLMPVNHSSCVDRLLDYMPDVIEKVNNMMNKHMQNKKEQTDKIVEKINEKTKEVKEKVENKDIKRPETIKEETTVEYEYNEMEDE